MEKFLTFFKVRKILAFMSNNKKNYCIQHTTQCYVCLSLPPWLHFSIVFYICNIKKNNGLLYTWFHTIFLFKILTASKSLFYTLKCYFSENIVLTFDFGVQKT